jgi:hypothetical protein
MYATRAYEFQGLPREIFERDPAPVAGVIVHWSKTKPPAAVPVERLSAVRLISSALGEIVVFRK